MKTDRGDVIIAEGLPGLPRRSGSARAPLAGAQAVVIRGTVAADGQPAVTIGRASGSVARVSSDYSGGVTVDAEVAGGLFVVRAPGPASGQGGGAAPMRIVARGASGSELGGVRPGA